MLQLIYAASSSSRLRKATRRQLRRFFSPERMAALSAPSPYMHYPPRRASRTPSAGSVTCIMITTMVPYTTLSRH
ncbi:unnamed protein product [Microthlaspi erraticum]|uniref:Uncharacterized protein n=1 Tax=Microthlaspi erraticum TaxID=1685480 RepID=A0A6D2JFL1_9BRAS|nr:unnamed protein product [Microthlaspi erraticum]